MSHKLLGILGVSAMLLAAPLGAASAADMSIPYKAPPPPASFSWTGCYIDGGIGYGLWNQDHNQYVTATGAGLTANTTDGGRGYLGRIGGGCDYQVGSSWVIGAFADYDIQDIKGTLSGIGVTGAVAGTTALVYGNEKETDAWYVGPRLGFLVTPGLLAYTDGGYTESRFGSINLIQEGTSVPAGARSIAAHTYNGWFLGGGYEYALNFLPIHGLFWRTEYRYSQYSSANLPILLASGAAGPDAINSKKEVQTITSSLVWRFNWWR
jgi:outer membrane immunogenic protein